MNFAILDCTLRDGGYYNNWDFDPEVVSKYLSSVAQSGIDYVVVRFTKFSKARIFRTICLYNRGISEFLGATRWANLWCDGRRENYTRIRL